MGYKGMIKAVGEWLQTLAQEDSLTRQWAIERKEVEMGRGREPWFFPPSISSALVGLSSTLVLTLSSRIPENILQLHYIE